MLLLLLNLTFDPAILRNYAGGHPYRCAVYTNIRAILVNWDLQVVPIMYLVLRYRSLHLVSLGTRSRLH